MKKTLLNKLFNQSQKFLFVGLIGLFALNANSQVTIHEELFVETLGSWTEYSVTGEDQMWEPDDFDDMGNILYFAEMNNFSGGYHFENDDWLISPPLNLNDFSNEILNIETAGNFNGPDLELYYSTNYDGSSDPSTNGTWTNVPSVTWSPGDYEVTNSGDIDLSGVSGNAVYLAIRYSGDDFTGKLWQVHSVTVTGNQAANTFDPVNAEIMTIPSIYNNYLNFEITDMSKDLTFELRDVTGRQLGYYTQEQLGIQARINVAELPKGMYVLVVNMNGQIRGYKVVR